MSEQKIVQMTPKEVESLVEQTVLKTLERFGMDSDDHIQTQRDFQFMRDWRISSEILKRKAILTILGIVIAGVAGALWVGFKIVISRS